MATPDEDAHMNSIMEQITGISTIVAELRSMSDSTQVDTMLNDLLLRTNKLSVLALTYSSRPRSEQSPDQEVPMAQTTTPTFGFGSGASSISGQSTSHIRQDTTAAPRFGTNF